ncbi:MAG: FHA domain-containing protein [Actinobacteria bacterium]|nr:FHA domain-containing protein [Actinomycetota bacterium]
MTTTAAGRHSGSHEHLHVRLTVRGAGLPSHDVELAARADATARAISDALAAHLGRGPTGALHCVRLGPLAPDRPLGQLGLRDGDIVGLEPLPPGGDTLARADAPPAELVVVAGPAAGTRIPLAPGAHALGRDPAAADVVLADPSISGRHVVLDVAADGSAAATDAGSTNGTAIDGVRLGAGERRALAPDDLLEVGRSLVGVRPYRRPDATIVEARGSRIAFNRPPRVSRAFDAATFRVEAPPQAPRGVRFPLVAAVVPLLMGVTLWVFLRSPTMLAMALFSPLMMAGSAIGDRRSGRREHAEQRAGFEARVAELEHELAAARAREVADRRAAAPDAAELAVRARRRLPELWERRPADADFLDVRVAIADQESVTAVAFGDGGDAALRARVEQLVARHRTVPNVPLRVRVREVGALGICGDARGGEALARWIVAQAAVLHSPRDLVVAAALGAGRADAWSWLGWLPHVSSETSPLDGPHVAVGDEAARDLVRRVRQLAHDRHEEPERRGRGRRRTALLLLVDDEVATEPAVVDELLADCGEVDLAVVWLARERRELPGGCGAIAELASDRAVARVTWAASGRELDDASVDGIPPDVAESIARALAPVVDVSAGGAAAEVPRHVSLVELLDLVEPTAEQIVGRWEDRDPSALRATLGAAAGAPFAIDLRTDGPHALIAGTTGAGKSLLLQSLVVSLAASHPPDRLAFLLVDYKGGAAFKDCRRLPHSVGMVTDLDEHEVRRVLVSLNAELRERERVLRDADARDLAELERRDPAAAPPSLAIVIDEFATLAREVPEFVDGIVDVAQRGRSLGVHAVLATQRPGNAVTDNIRANTSLRIALRVARAEDSEDVIGAPDAARLLPSFRGRALARSGPGELTPFQVGYVGARTTARRARAPIEVADLAFGVRRDGAAAADLGASDETDLDLLVAAIRAAAERAGIAPPARPWLPPLPDALELDPPAVGAKADDPVVVGLVDEPRRQRQTPFAVDLPRDGNLLVFGASGSGKTTLLRTLALALAEAAPPTDLQLYGLDFAGRGLAALETLPHCGSIVPGEDEERVGRLLALLRRTIDRRARLFAAAGAATLGDYRRLRPDAAEPRIVLLVDSYAGFVDAYDKVDLGALVDALPRLVADGRAAGVHVVITADRRQAVPTAIASIVTRRVILRMAVEEEYAALGLDRRETHGATLPPGRGFLDDGREVQIAVPGGAIDPERQVRALAHAAERLAAAHRPELAAPPVTAMPLDVPRATLPGTSRPLHAPLGVEEHELAPFELSLEAMHFAVIGPYRSGRTSALATLVAALRASTPGLRTHLLAPRRSGLLDDGGWTSVARGTEACEARVGELLDALVTRAEECDGEPELLVIDDGGELAESSCAPELEQLLKRGRDRDLRALVALETGHARHYAAWIRELRKDGHGLLLDPSYELDGELLGVRLPRRANAVFPPGRGYAVVDGAVTLVQVAR